MGSDGSVGVAIVSLGSTPAVVGALDTSTVSAGVDDETRVVEAVSSSPLQATAITASDVIAMARRIVDPSDESCGRGVGTAIS